MKLVWEARPTLVPFAAPSTGEWRSRWLAAMRWRRQIEKALVHSGLTFTQWQILEATAAVIDETGDAVSQNQIATRTELDRTTVSQVMRMLDKKHLVDRGPCFVGTSYRVFLTDRAIRLLNEHRPAVEIASRGRFIVE